MFASHKQWCVLMVLPDDCTFTAYICSQLHSGDRLWEGPSPVMPSDADAASSSSRQARAAAAAAAAEGGSQEDALEPAPAGEAQEPEAAPAAASAASPSQHCSLPEPEGEDELASRISISPAVNVHVTLGSRHSSQSDSQPGSPAAPTAYHAVPPVGVLTSASAAVLSRGAGYAFAVWAIPGAPSSRGVWAGGPRAWRQLTLILPGGRYIPGDPGIHLQRFESLDEAKTGYELEADLHGAPLPAPFFIF